MLQPAVSVSAIGDSASGATGRTFVTARGWSDLSDMIRLYEKNGDRVDEKLVCQYLQNPKIAKDFAIYYDLFNKYRADYQVDRILDGKAEAAITDRAKAAKFDERLSLLGLLLDAIDEKLRGVIREESALGELMAALKAVRLELARPNADADAALQKQIDQRRRELETGKRAGTLSEDHAFALNRTIVLLDAQRAMLQMEQPSGGMEAFKLLRTDFDKQTKALKTAADKAGKQLSNVFRFCEDAFDEGQEMLILVTELTISRYAARFISRYGCPEYFAHNKELLFYERQMELIAELDNLEL